MGKGDLEDIVDNRVLAGPGMCLEKPVRPADYVRCVQEALGIEETPEDADRARLQEEVRMRLPDAGPGALRRALSALKSKDGGGPKAEPGPGGK
jgi:hypothetical protein